MKINEIFTEGIFDFLTRPYTASQANQPSPQERQAQTELTTAANKLVDKWLYYVGQTQDNKIKNWANNYFQGEVNVNKNIPSNVTDRTQVSNYFKNLYQQYYTIKNPKAGSSAPNVRPNQQLVALQKMLTGKAPLGSGSEWINLLDPTQKSALLAIISQASSSGRTASAASSAPAQTATTSQRQKIQQVRSQTAARRGSTAE